MMARDIKIKWDNDLLFGDFELADGEGDLVRETGLETAVMISLFTDGRADDDDELDNPDDKRGWWGDLTTGDDDLIGSKLWLLDRSKTTNETIEKTKQYIEEALQWMIDDGVAAKVAIEVERQGDPENARLATLIKIHKSDGNIENFKFDDLWKAQLSI